MTQTTLRQRMARTAIVLILLRLFYSIPTPFVDRNYLKEVISGNGTLGLMNVLSGNSLSNMSIMAIGITPAITASIIIQLLGIVFPRLGELPRGGREEQRQYKRITVITGLGLAAFQAAVMAVSYSRRGLFSGSSWYAVLLVTVIWLLGSGLAMLAGWFISERIICDRNETGTSLIITMGILSSYISDAAAMVSAVTAGRRVAFILLNICIVCGVVFLFTVMTVVVHQTEKVFKVTYSRTLRTTGAPFQKDFSLKMCPGSVIPIIFASSLLSLPSIICTLGGWSPSWLGFFNMSYWFDPAHPIYTCGAVLYAVLIVGFSVFYIDMSISPYEIADNLRKSGGVIVKPMSIRPGKPTADYLRDQSVYMVIWGGIALSVLCLAPLIFGRFIGVDTVSISFLGSSMIIVVSILLQLREQVRADNMTRRYVAPGAASIFGA